VLRVDHGGAIAQQRPFAHHAGVMRQDGDAALRSAIQETQHQLVDERRLARTARASETDDSGLADIRFSTVVSPSGRRATAIERAAFASGVCILYLSQFVRQLLVGRFRSASFGPWFAITAMDELHHFLQGRPGKKDLVHAFAFHDFGVVVRDGAAAAAKNADVCRAFPAQQTDNFGEKLDVAAVVTGNANRPHILLDGGADNVAYRAMVANVDDLDAVSDELQIDGVNGAVVPIANGNGGQNPDR